MLSLVEDKFDKSKHKISIFSKLKKKTFEQKNMFMSQPYLYASQNSNKCLFTFEILLQMKLLYMEGKW